MEKDVQGLGFRVVRLGSRVRGSEEVVRLYTGK